MKQKDIILTLKGKKSASLNNFLALFFISSLLLLCTGCLGKVEQQSSTHFLMDTVVQIDIYTKDERQGQEAIKRAFNLMRQVADRTDRYNPSEVSEVSSSAGIRPVKVSADVLAIAKFVKTKDDGKVDITIGPLVDLWNGNKEKNTLPAGEEVNLALDKIGMENLLIDENDSTLYLKGKGMSLDFGAVAKGWAVEQAGQLLAEDENIVCALVNGGGNIKVVGMKPDGKPWRIGVQDPRQLSEYLGILQLSAGDAVATSGDYQRYYEIDGKRYHHLLDPQTGHPANLNISATAVTKDAFLADYYSTLLFLMPARQAIDFAEQTEGLNAIIVGSDMNVYISSGLKESFKKNEESAWSFIQR